MKQILFEMGEEEVSFDNSIDFNPQFLLDELARWGIPHGPSVLPP